MDRIIVNKDKVKTTIYKNLTLVDGVIIFIALMLSLLILSSNINLRIYLLVFMDSLLFSTMFSINNEKIYEIGYYIIKYFIVSKVIDKMLVKKRETVLDTIYGNIENMEIARINTIPFSILDEKNQDEIIDRISSLSSLLKPSLQTNLVSVDSSLDVDSALNNYESLKSNLYKMYEDNLIKKDEFIKRNDLINIYISSLKDIKKEGIKVKEFYLIINKLNHEYLNELIKLSSKYSLKIERVENKESVVSKLTKASKNSDMKVGLNSIDIDDKKYKLLYVDRLPIVNSNGYLNKILNSENVVSASLSFSPLSQYQAIKRIDNSILEMESKSSLKASSLLDKEEIIDSLNSILSKIKNGDEEYLNFSLILMCEIDKVLSLKQELKMIGFRGVERLGRNKEMIKKMTNNLSNFKDEKGVNSSSLIAAFPFDSKTVKDDSGLMIGYDKEITQIDFFKRDEEHLNSNMVVIGKSGSGKSYFSKSLITNLSLKDTRIFILDPEGEYEKLTKELNGECISIGDSKNLSINPLEVINEDNDFISHLQFLEEFYRTLFVGISSDDLDELMIETKRLYKSFKIDKYTEIEKLSSYDYPNFYDLYMRLKEKSNKKTIIQYVEKLVDGIYQDFNTLTTFSRSKQVVDLSFKKLMSSKNKNVINANLLLVLKLLESEVIKGKELKQKTVIVIDEAHLFIDEKFPIALDFMYEMAKRIRKYNGMQIIITQNVKDFCLSEEIKRKSMAIISVSQYSLIFSLSPSDLKDLCSLYEVKKLNEKEIELISLAKLGYAFFIKNPSFRTSFRVVTPKQIEEKFN